MMIRCPIRVVSEYTANPDHASEWYVNIKSVEWITSRPLRLGSRVAFKANFLGRELAYEYEVVEFRSEERLVMRTVNGPFPMETSYEWVSVSPIETLMKLRNLGEPGGFSKLFAPMVGSAMRKANLKDLKKAKSILENKHFD
ncbi:hypothetical protein D3C81_1277430 [compost metagenome]